jgi:hypothetical protein
MQECLLDGGGYAMKLWMLVMLLLWPCSVSAALCTLTWTANTENLLAGYWLYHGLQSGIYDSKLGPIVVNSTPATTCDDWGILNDNKTHFFAVTAFLSSGLESARSDEVSIYLLNNMTKVDTSTTITSITGSNLTDQPYTVASAVSPGGTGTVTVTDGTGASCSSVAPTGSCNLTSTTAGTKTITAAYGGDSTYNASQGTTTFVVSSNTSVPNTPGNVNGIKSSTKVNRTTVYSAKITWADNSLDESGFKLQRYKTTAKGCILETTFTVTVGANITSYTDSTASSQTCGYGVASYNSAGTSTFVADFNLSQ